MYSKETLLSHFNTLRAQNRIPHGIVIETSNSDDISLAKDISAVIMCERFDGGACMECVSCRKIYDDCNPDVSVIREEKKAGLSVDTVRRIIMDSVIKPNESPRKVYIIPKAETMTREAQNAALKLIEEPPPFVSFIFIVSNSARLLETIRSRSQIFTVSDSGASDDEEREIVDNILRAISDKSVSGLLFATAKLVESKDRVLLNSILRELIQRLRECMIAGINRSSRNDICADIARKFSTGKLIDMIKASENAIDYNDRNINLQLLITDFTVNIQKSFNR